MSSNEVSVVLVHGAWADGSSWAKVIAQLATGGIKVVAAPLPLTSFRDDVAALDRTLERVMGPIVLVGHAYAGAVIGADGFGYRTVDGRHIHLPHFGTVRIEDDVEIGAGTTVDRAMIDETVVGQGTKLDNLIMIGHNCEIGRHNLFASQVGFAGSVTTGDYVVCAGQVGVADHIHIGNRAVLGAKAGVHKDVPEGQRQIGIPAIPEAECRRVVMAQHKLPEMRQQVREMERQLEKLLARIDEHGAQGQGPRREAA